MAYAKYRFALVSEEKYGASRANVVEMSLDDASSDADALTFGTNLAAVFKADVVSIDKELTTDYTLPYPAGTNVEWRMVFRDAAYIVQTERIYDIKTSAAPDPAATWAALKAAGFLVYPAAGALASVQLAVFVPTASV